jgi:hypothetical protein
MEQREKLSRAVLHSVEILNFDINMGGQHLVKCLR